MKRIALILSLIIVAAGVIIAGNYHWKQSVGKTAKKAEVALHVTSNSKNANNDSSIAPASDSNTQNAQGASSTSSDTSNGQINTDQTGQDSTIGQSGETGQKSNSQTQSGEAQSAKTGTTPASGSVTTNSTTSVSTNSTKKSAEEIKSQYRSLFSELEAAETSKIDQLVVSAKAEYVSKKTSKAELAAKYQAAAKQMEQNADSSFYVLYQHLQYDLDKNGYSLNEAQEFQRAYNTKKQENENRIISQVRGF